MNLTNQISQAREDEIRATYVASTEANIYTKGSLGMWLTNKADNEKTYCNCASAPMLKEVKKALNISLIGGAEINHLYRIKTSPEGCFFRTLRDASTGNLFLFKFNFSSYDYLVLKDTPWNRFQIAEITATDVTLKKQNKEWEYLNNTASLNK